MSVLKDWLEDLNFSGRFMSCVVKNVLFNVFVVGLANCISLLKNTERLQINCKKTHCGEVFFCVGK